MFLSRLQGGYFQGRRRYPIEYYLGIDLGTSDVKTILLDRTGRSHGAVSEGYQIFSPHPGWAEQRPEDWWKAVCDAVRWTIKDSGVRPRDISGICVSGQMHGGVFLDRKMELLGPAIIWADTRSREQVREIYDRVGRARLGKIARSPVATGFLAPTLMWLKKETPGTYNKIHRVLQPKDYIRFRITGEDCADVSDASGTLLFDTGGRKWSHELLDALEIEGRLLPLVGESVELCGRVIGEAASALGVAEGTPVIRGGGDTPVAAIGNGIIEPGTIAVTLGTGGQVIAALDEPIYDPELRTHTFCHAAPGRWYIMGAILAGGMSLRWLRQLLGERFSFAEFSAIAAEITPGSEGLFFMPYLIGERTPHMDSDARGALIGLTPRHTPAHLARAVMEGVAFALKEAFDILVSLGINPGRVVTGGGGGQSHIWRQIIADVLGVELHVMASAESSVTGAAILAAVGAGAFSNMKEACDALIPDQETVTKPNPEYAEMYRKAYSIYRSLYPANEPVFHVIANLI